MELHLTGKTVLVTGAASGVGAAAALLYAEYGAKVIVADASEKGGQDIVARIKSSNGKAVFIKTGAGSLADCALLIKTVVSLYGSIDIACNNINVVSDTGNRIGRDPETFTNEVDFNLDTLFYYMKFEIAAMQKQKKGVIVNITHAAGSLGLVTFSPFVNLKFGLMELMPPPASKRPFGKIRLYAVTPALMNAALQGNPDAAENPTSIKLSSIDRIGKIEEAARLIIWLSTDGVHW
ncbi:MAG: SDR family NAD(P)-dependent oxidoreductase, partial [Bacteroidota bacterium]